MDTKFSWRWVLVTAAVSGMVGKGGEYLLDGLVTAWRDVKFDDGWLHSIGSVLRQRVDLPTWLLIALLVNTIAVMVVSFHIQKRGRAAMWRVLWRTPDPDRVMRLIKSSAEAEFFANSGNRANQGPTPIGRCRSKQCKVGCLTPLTATIPPPARCPTLHG